MINKRTISTRSSIIKSLIDVVIPVYNGDKFIIQTIKSIENQTYVPNKIIIIDDGSTDNTAELILNHQGSIPIQYVKQENSGLSSARNAGIQNSTNKYIAFLDADDQWYPNKLEEQIKIFENSNFENLGVVYCQYDIIDNNGNQTNKYYIFKIDHNIKGKIFEKILPLNKIASSASGALVKRECFDKIGLFDENLTAYEDWDLWLRLARHYEFDYSGKILVSIRRYGKNMQDDKLHMYTNALTFYNKWFSILPENVVLPQMWVKFIIKKIFTRLPKLDFIKLFKKKLTKEFRYRLYKTTIDKLKIYLLLNIILLPFLIFMNIIKPIQTNTTHLTPSLLKKIRSFFGLLINIKQKIFRRFFSPRLLQSNSDEKSFIFTEIYGCAKIGKIALDSFTVHHPTTNIHIFGTPDDFKQIEKRSNFILHDISEEKKIIHNFNFGHLGTASLWAKIILERDEKYIIHFDSDVIFRDKVFDDIIAKLKEGYSIVGPIRNYKHNPNNLDHVRHLSDLSQTLCFGFDRTKITGYDYNTLTKMCEGKYNPLGHPVIDFFDSVMFDILQNGGIIYHLNQDEFGGCNFYGKRTNKYPELNALIDFGDKLVHFSAVGSGMYYLTNEKKISSKVPKPYVDYAIEKYAIFCKIFYHEDLGITIDENKYRPLLDIKDWYNNKTNNDRL